MKGFFARASINIFDLHPFVLENLYCVDIQKFSMCERVRVLVCSDINILSKH